MNECGKSSIGKRLRENIDRETDTEIEIEKPCQYLLPIVVHTDNALKYIHWQMK